MNKPIGKWTKKEFQELPLRGRQDQYVGKFDSLVILPTKHTHDSGYACMDFVAVLNGKPICRLSGGSDVLHINGISGQGKFNARTGAYPNKNNLAWSIDCLPKSKLLQVFCASSAITAGKAYSSFEIFAETIK